jgi:cold-inducible RNA-binding protein
MEINSWALYRGDAGWVSMMTVGQLIWSYATSVLVPHFLDLLLTFPAGISVAFARDPERTFSDRSRSYGETKPMAKKLYVGNLEYTVTSEMLQDMFTPHGTVQSAQVIEDRDAGRSKGFGFVEMSSDEEANSAIAALNGKDQGGRALTVNEAKPRENRGGSSRR